MLDEYMLYMLLNKIYLIYGSEDLGDFFRGRVCGNSGILCGFYGGIWEISGGFHRILRRLKV